jgi:hypothetical protein
MKHIATVAMMLNLGVLGVYAQQNPVKMTFSGTVEPSTINLQPGTNTDEVNLAGSGAQGQFTYRELHADTASPQPSSTCSGPTHLFFQTVAGGGVFRFQDGSLLTVRMTGGAACVDLTAGVANFTVTYQVTGGTGRFKGASGALTSTGMLIPVLFNASNTPALSTSTGEFDGTVFGVAIGEGGQDERQ